MQLDSEQDRRVLLDLIQSSTIPGQAVLLVAALVKRIQDAEVADPGDDQAKGAG